QSLDRSAALARPEAKYDPRQVNHVAISDRSGCLTSRQLQLYDAIELFEPGLNPLWLLEACIRNHSPAAFTILKQPFHRPMIDTPCAANQPGSPLRQERR